MRIFQFLLVICIGICKYTAGAPGKGCGQPADVVFIIDASRSIWGFFFQTELNFLKKVVGNFIIGSQGTRIGAVSFSDGIQQEFNLGDFKSKQEVQRALVNIVQMNGADTETYKGLKHARKVMFKTARKNVAKIAIVLTDGRSSNTSLTAKEAGKLREEGVQIFAVGIGSKIDKAELDTIASTPSDKFVLEVTSFRTLHEHKAFLVFAACPVTTTPAPTQPPTTTPTTTTTTTTTTPTTTTTTTTTTTSTTTTTTTTPTTTTTTTITPTTTTTTATTTTPTTTTSTTTTTTTKPTTTVNANGIFGIQGDEAVKACGGKPADIIFVLDISSSIYIDDFYQQLHFVSDVVDIFDVGPEKTQVAVVSFSDNATTEFYLKDYKTREEIEKNIMGVEYTGGKTYTDKALGKVIQEVMTIRYGYRKSVAHVVIVITDGMSAEPDKTAAIATKLKKKGTYVFAIGVSNFTDLPELQAIASEPSEEFVYQVNGYDALQKLKNILAYKTCKVIEPLPQSDQPQPCRSTKKAEVLYVTDFNGADRFDVDRSIEMVQETSESLNMGPDGVQVGLISNECPDIPDIGLGTYKYSDEFARALAPSKTVPLSSLIKRTRTAMRKARKGANKVAVVMVNGPIPNPKEAAREVLRASHQHIEMVFVRAGPRAVMNQIRNLSDRPVLDVESPTFKDDLSERICRAVG